MRIRKVSIADEEIITRRRVHRHAHISFWSEEFDCGGHVSQVIYRKGDSKKEEREKPNFGVSKLEYTVSNKYLVNGCIFYIKGNSV